MRWPRITVNPFRKVHLNLHANPLQAQLPACGARFAARFATAHAEVTCQRCKVLIRDYPNLVGPNPTLPPPAPESTTP